MKDNLTELALILDKSGSMSSLRSDAVGGFNSFIEEQQKVPGEANFTLVLFDSVVNFIHRRLNLQKVNKMTDGDYHPSSMTALLDAIGMTIDYIGKELDKLPEDEKPSKVIVAILTDGLENDSHKYSREQIFKMISDQQNTWKWEFIFLAANQDAIATAINLGMNRDLASNYVSTPVGLSVGYKSLTQTVTQSRMQKTK